MSLTLTEESGWAFIYIGRQMSNSYKNYINKIGRNIGLLLLGDTNSLTLVTGSLGMLTTDTQAPIMTQTSVGANLLQTLQVLTKLVVEHIGQSLGGLAVLDVTPSVKEPIRDLVLPKNKKYFIKDIEKRRNKINLV